MSKLFDLDSVPAVPVASAKALGRTNIGSKTGTSVYARRQSRRLRRENRAL